ncbi:MAG TPA: FIST C-terminal domain-containing protein, partial [Kofleriaceae bacterium]|nr:FIST C-terminal domain-containing protein [Kofleriaceae bacterium]
PPAAVALGLYGDWLRVGVGAVGELAHGGLTRGRDAVHQAAAALGTTVDALDPARHVAIALHDGTSPGAEAFYIGSAATAPKLRFLGGGASIDPELDPAIALGGDPSDHPAAVWAHGEARGDAGVVAVLECDQPFHVVSSCHLVASELKTVVTAVSGPATGRGAGRVIDELDGRPAASRLRQLVAQLGDELDLPRPIHALARFLDGVPYVRSIVGVVGERVILASAVEPGHVLRVMRPGALGRTTARDLATATERVGGAMAAFVAFACQVRQREAHLRHTERELAAMYATCPMVGFHTVSEQSGMLLVNHTLTGLAIGAIKS